MAVGTETTQERKEHKKVESKVKRDKSERKPKAKDGSSSKTRQEQKPREKKDRKETVGSSEKKKSTLEKKDRKETVGSSEKKSTLEKKKSSSEKKSNDQKQKTKPSIPSTKAKPQESDDTSGMDTPSEEEVIVEIPQDFNMTDRSRMAMLVPNPDGTMKLVPIEDYEKGDYSKDSDSVDTISDEEEYSGRDKVQ